MNKKLLFISLIALYGNAGAADFIDTARVVSSTPVYERVNEPRRECSVETVQSAPQERSIGGGLIGGLVGGLIGSQLGAGHGNTVATGAGAIAGALIGDRAGNQQQQATQQVQHCRDTDNYRDVLRGYSVTYRYSGKQTTTTLPYQPGATVKVGISLIPEQPQPYRDNQQYEQNRTY